MASKKRVEIKKIQINTTVDDQQKSIDELISHGVRTYNRENAGGHYQRRRNQLPPSFGNKPKSRGSSVGHSREGSSDDGFGSSGRQTLSPSSVSGNVAGFHPYHPRQTSAPALIEYNVMEQHASSSGSNRTMPSGLPPVNRSVSTSMTAMANIPQQTGLAPGFSGTGSAYTVPHQQSPEILQPCHGISKSLDLPTVHHNYGVKNESFEMPASLTTTTNTQYTSSGPASHGYYPDSSRMGYWQDDRAKSRSLDAMTIHHMNESSPQSMTSPGTSGVDDGLGPLPKGWIKSFDVNGEPYFIDHNTQTTSWFDPRLPTEMQEEAIRNRHQFNQMPQQAHQQYVQQSGHQVESYQPDYPHVSNSTNDRVNQLRMYRHSLTERQQQLCREGLLPPQQAPQYQMMPQNYGYVQGQQDAMDVDYGHGGLGMQHSNLDPAFVQDLNPADLNPQEFDKYLYIDRKPQATARFNM